MKLTGSRLKNSLTEKEFLSFIDCMIENIDLDLVLRKCDKATAETIKKIMGKHSAGLAENVVSDSKLIQIWNDHFSELSDIVFGVSDEEGDYIVQDHHWETPYLDTYLVADLMDQIAKKLSSIIDDIFLMKIEEENPFMAICIELEDSIGSLPEWMGADSEPVYLEEHFIFCLLKWEWLSSLEQENAVQIFISSFKGFAEECKMIEIDNCSILDFVLSLGIDCKKKFFLYLNNPPNKKLIKEIAISNNLWHALYMELAKLFDFDKFLKLSEKHIYDNWKYGIEVIKHNFENKNFEETVKFAKKTIDSLFHKKSWNIEDMLFDHYLKNLLTDGHEIFLQVLDYWAKSEKALKNIKEADIINFNIFLLEDLYNIKKVVNAYNKMEQKSEAVEAVYNKWKSFITGCFSAKEDNLLTWIIEYAENNKADTLMDKITDLISSSTIGENKQIPQEIKTLSQYLGLISKFKEEFSLIMNDICFWPSNQGLQDSCREVLSGRNAEEIASMLFNWWKKHFYKLVPDPRNNKNSDYSCHAHSLNVLKSINIDDYNTILGNWKRDHRLRKNLWKKLGIKLK